MSQTTRNHAVIRKVHTYVNDCSRMSLQKTNGKYVPMCKQQQEIMLIAAVSFLEFLKIDLHMSGEWHRSSSYDMHCIVCMSGTRWRPQYKGNSNNLQWGHRIIRCESTVVSELFYPSAACNSNESFIWVVENLLLLLNAILIWYTTVPFWFVKTMANCRIEATQKRFPEMYLDNPLQFSRVYNRMPEQIGHQPAVVSGKGENCRSQLPFRRTFTYMPLLEIREVNGQMHRSGPQKKNVLYTRLCLESARFAEVMLRVTKWNGLTRYHISGEISFSRVSNQAQYCTNPQPRRNVLPLSGSVCSATDRIDLVEKVLSECLKNTQRSSNICC